MIMEKFELRNGDCMQELCKIDKPVDMIFADPPYFLSSGNGPVKIGSRYVNFDKEIGIEYVLRKKYTDLIISGFHCVEIS